MPILSQTDATYNNTNINVALMILCKLMVNHDFSTTMKLPFLDLLVLPQVKTT